MSLSSSSNAYNVPWVEKYRPIKVTDIVVNKDAVSRLQVIARNNNMPNLILSMICSMVELTVQQVEKLREMGPLYEFVKDGINIKDIQWTQH
ncbi:Replication factor C subunit 2 [Glycine soja]|uniref:Replication factor C subunit 2 n=1 Tax=Glycine soja TaxID=3848 RepID=A0A445GXM5_GLYSO|nr:Replication factor C subunit 2 [Glycine soja]